MHDIARLRDFVAHFTRLAEATRDEVALIDQGLDLLSWLVGSDDWLPDACAVPSPQNYRQYLLHCDPLERFSIVSFVWGPGQATPVHNHTVWGLIGMLRGQEFEQRFDRRADGALIPFADAALQPGEVSFVSPATCDLHRVSNAVADRPSISIHVYGGNIGAIHRRSFDTATGAAKPFVSGYSNDTVPNLWARGAAAR